MDFRLQKLIKKYMLAKNLWGDCDVVSLAGAAKILADGNDQEKNFLLRQIRISLEKHNISQIIFMHHTRCGAYASEYEFAGHQEEIACHAFDLAQAEALVKSHCPALAVRKVLMVMEDDRGERAKFITLPPQTDKFIFNFRLDTSLIPRK